MTARTDVGTVEDLHASASRLTGLDDFGGDDHLDGLRVLLSSYTGLTPQGSKATRLLLRSALMSRLLSEAGWRQHPGYVQVAVRQPVFVTGLPRTGTTALHRMLAANPAHQGLELWLTEAPQPRPPVSSWDAHPVFAMLRLWYAERHDVMGLHAMGPAEVEECWRLLRQSMMSVSFECTAAVPAYSRWLAAQDWTAAYRRHRRNLQLIGLNDPGRRWVLKNPSHLFALDALLAVYPDAVVIQTHRSPRAAIASVCSLNARACAGWSTSFSGPALGRAQLELWSRGVREFMAARARHDPARFIDVAYDDLVADPAGTLGAIYARLGEPPHAPPAPATPRAEHRYRLADYGLTEDEVDEAFAGYVRSSEYRRRAVHPPE